MKSFLSMAALLAASGVASAQPHNGVAFAGGSVGEGTSGYAGAVVALPGNQLGKGLAFRASGAAGEYDYTSGPGGIEAGYRSGELALVYQSSGNWGWGNLSVGGRLTDTKLSPDDPSNDSSGTRLDVVFQSDGGYKFEQWLLGWFGSIGILDGAYQGRLQLGRFTTAAERTRLGVEVGVSGNPSYTVGSVGGFIATKLSPDVEGQISIGATEQAGRSARPYGSIGLSALF